jgi:exodeoxyribonuclease VII small subunit
MAKKYSYTQASDELNIIINELQDELVTIDQLPKKIEKASALVDLCYKQLKGTEEQISIALQHLNSLE